MTRRWGLQATMTATYVAVTAGVVLLTELVIFGVAALSPPTPLTPQAVQGLAQAHGAGDGRQAGEGRTQARAPQAAELAADLVTGRRLGRRRAGAARRRRRRGHPAAHDRRVRPGSRVLRRRRVHGRHRARLLLPGVLPAGQPRLRRAGGACRARCSPRSSAGRCATAGRHRSRRDDVVWATAPITASRAGRPVRDAERGEHGDGGKAGRPAARPCSACSTWRFPPRRRGSAGSPSHRAWCGPAWCCWRRRSPSGSRSGCCPPGG